MVNVQAQFDLAVKKVKDLPPTGPVKPTQEDQLAFYGHFKQANEGDNTTTKPGTFDFKGKYKWQAWKDLEGLSKEDAKTKYVALFRDMLEKSGDEDSKKIIAELDAAGAQ